jgi:hypothetical protein
MTLPFLEFLCSKSVISSLVKSYIPVDLPIDESNLIQFRRLIDACDRQQKYVCVCVCFLSGTDVLMWILAFFVVSSVVGLFLLILTSTILCSFVYCPAADRASLILPSTYRIPNKYTKTVCGREKKGGRSKYKSV